MRKYSRALAASLLVLGTIPVQASWDEGVAALASKDFQRAVFEFQEFVQQNPDHWQAHFYLGQAYSSNGQFREAVATLEKAKTMTTEPRDRERVWKQLGFAYERQKKYPPAIDAYQNAGDRGSVARVKEHEEVERQNKLI